MTTLPRVVELVDGHVQLELVPLLARTPDGELVAENGPNEYLGDMILACASEIAVGPASLAEMAACVETHRSTIPLGWEECAVSAGLDVGAVKECAIGPQGEALMEAAYASSEDVLMSPWVVVDGVPFNLSLEPPDVAEAICCAMDEGERPDACPAEPSCTNVPVAATVVTDARCEDCEALIEEVLFSVSLHFPLLSVTTLEWQDPAARELAAAADVEILPALVFHEDAEDSPAWELMSPFTRTAGPYHVVKASVLGAAFDPTREICDNDRDDTGDGLADCDSPECAESLPCRPEQLATLDLFVMSECPFGEQALGAMYELSHHFGGAMTLRVHWLSTAAAVSELDPDALESFCVTRDDRALCAMHGRSEAEENLRQSCVQDIYTTAQFVSYLQCMTSPLEMGWEECAAAAELDADEIAACAGGGRGFELLEDDARLADALSIDASPTYVFNNKYLEAASPWAGDIAEKLCSFNPDLPACQSIGSLPTREEDSAGQCVE
jgi:hypothetical protein